MIFAVFNPLLLTTTIATTVLWLTGFCPGQPGWASTRRNIHPLTSIMVIGHPLSASSIYYDPLHPSCSIYMTDSLFAQSLSKLFFGIPLGLAPSNSYCIDFFTQSSSSFCPYHHNLLRCSTETVSSNPSHSLNPLLGTLSFSLMPHIPLTILMTARWSATSFSFSTG